MKTQKGFSCCVSPIVIQRSETAASVAPHLDHRMNREVDGVTEPVEDHRCRIDQESHVVDYRFDNGERTRLRGLCLGWVVCTQQELPGLSLLGEVQVGECACVKRLRV